MDVLYPLCVNELGEKISRFEEETSRFAVTVVSYFVMNSMDALHLENWCKKTRSETRRKVLLIIE